MNLLGLDLGQANDSSAICLLQRVEEPLKEFIPEPPVVIRCQVTKNPVGTDTWSAGTECPCKICQAWLKQCRVEKGEIALADLKPIEPDQTIRPEPGSLTNTLYPRLAGDPEFDLPEDKLEVIKMEDVLRRMNKLNPKQQGELIRNYKCKFLKRWQLGTSYVDIVKDVKKLCQHPIIANEKSVLVVDNTGVGRPVVDMFRKAKMNIHIVPVTITGGKNVVIEPNEIHVPKGELVSLLTVMLETKRIGFAAGIPEVQALLQELREFKVKVTKAANETYGAEGNAHDDLVLSVALALYIGERQNQKLRVW